jgi:DNA-directed RNA polymerase beta' subunit
MNALSAGYALTSKDIIVSKGDIQGAYNDVFPSFTFKSFCDRALIRGGNMYYSNTDVYDSITLTPKIGDGVMLTEGQELYLDRGDIVNIGNGQSYLIEEKGTYKIVNGEVMINRSLIKVTADNWSGIPDFYDGKLYFSISLPSNFQYRRGQVLIQDGIMLSGQLTKEHIGGSSGSIIQVIYSDYGKDVCSKFVGDSTHILDEYARKRGISVGVYDYCPGISSEKKKDDLQHARHKVMVELKNKILDLPDVTTCNIEMKKRVENKIVEYMEQATNEIGIKILNEYTDADSGLTIMANSGAKGSSDNVAHTTGIIGPQYERGHRIQYAISGGTRTTPYFVPNDTDVESRGFVFRNYGEGVTPADAAHMSVPTRTSIVNTAVEVSTSGYLARKLARFLEDVVASYLGSVTINAIAPGGKVETVSRIASLVYGDDGFDVSKLENVKTPIGNIFLPVNIERVVSKINAKYGIFDNVMKDSKYEGPIEYEE